MPVSVSFGAGNVQDIWQCHQRLNLNLVQLLRQEDSDPPTISGINLQTH